VGQLLPQAIALVPIGAHVAICRLSSVWQRHAGGLKGLGPGYTLPALALRRSRRLGFDPMQFKPVVSYQPPPGFRLAGSAMDFVTIGTLPWAFRAQATRLRCRGAHSAPSRCMVRGSLSSADAQLHELCLAMKAA